MYSLKTWRDVLYSNILKSISLSCTLDLWFCNIGNMESSGSPILADLLNVTFHYMILVITTNLIRKAYRYLSWSCQIHGHRYKLSTILIFSWKLGYFIIENKYFSRLPWSNKLTLFACEKMSGRYPSLNGHRVTCSYR